jgi:hypothetical protein
MAACEDAAKHRVLIHHLSLGQGKRRKTLIMLAGNRTLRMQTRLLASSPDFNEMEYKFRVRL